MADIGPLGQALFRLAPVPARAAYLIAARSSAGLRRAIQEASTRWAGATEPIIPVRGPGRSRVGGCRLADGINPRDLLRSVLITSGGLTKRMDRLETLGLIRRHADPGDRRGTLLRLTPAGVDRIDQVIPSLLEMEHRHLSEELNPKQLDQAASLLRRLTLATQDPNPETQP